MYTTSTSVPKDTGLALADRYPWFILSPSGYQSMPMNPGQRPKILFADSIYYSTSTWPTHAVFNGTLFVYPDGGTVWLLPNYSVLHSDTVIPYFPKDLEHGVVLYAAMQRRLAQILSASAEIDLTYSNIVASSAGVVTIDALPLVPPSYSSPTLPDVVTVSTTPPSAPTISDLVVGISPPSPPTISAFTYSGGLTTPSAVSLLDATASPPDVPTISEYTPPTLTPPTAPTISAFVFSEDVVIPVFDPLAVPEPPTFTDITIPVGVALPDALSATTNILITAAAAAGIDPETIAALATPVPVYTKVNPTLSFANFTTRAGADDVEMAQTYLAEVDRLLADWRQDVEEELNEFNAEYQVWRAQVERTMEQARINLQQKIQDAQQEDQTAQFNALKNFEETLEEFRAKYQVQQSNIERYVQYVNSEVNRKSANVGAQVQVYSAEIRSLIDIFQAEMQGFSSLVNAEIQAYRTEIEGLSQNFSNEITLYTTRLRTAIEQWSQEAQVQAQLYNSEVSGYAAEVGATSDHNNARTSRFQAEIQKYSAQVEKELRGWQVNAETLLNSYSTEMNGYSVQVNSLVQIYSSQNTARAQIYGAQIQGFSAQIQAVAEQNSTITQRFSAEIQDAFNVTQKDSIAYQAAISRAIEQARLESQRLGSNAQMAQTAEQYNRLNDLNAQVQEWQLKLQRLAQIQAELSGLSEQLQFVINQYMHKRKINDASQYN